MSQLPNSKRLLNKLKNAIKEVQDEKMNNSDGEKVDIPASTKNYMIVKRMTNIITQHLADNMIQIPEIEETKLKFGSGDTGRQTQLILKPADGVDKNDLHKIATKIHLFFQELFPTKAMIGVKHSITGNEDGEIVESENFHLFVVYNVRSSSSGPSKPAGERTEVFYNEDYSK